jgi:hypothetical protein
MRLTLAEQANKWISDCIGVRHEPGGQLDA